MVNKFGTCDSTRVSAPTHRPDQLVDYLGPLVPPVDLVPPVQDQLVVFEDGVNGTGRRQPSWIVYFFVRAPWPPVLTYA